MQYQHEYWGISGSLLFAFCGRDISYALYSRRAVKICGKFTSIRLLFNIIYRKNVGLIKSTIIYLLVIDIDLCRLL